MTDLPIYQVVDGACAGLGRNYDWFVLPLLPVTKATLVNIEYQLTWD
jgi:hypothetical protein